LGPKALFQAWRAPLGIERSSCQAKGSHRIAEMNPTSQRIGAGTETVTGAEGITGVIEAFVGMMSAIGSAIVL